MVQDNLPFTIDFNSKAFDASPEEVKQSRIKSYQYSIDQYKDELKRNVYKSPRIIAIIKARIKGLEKNLMEERNN